MKFDPVTANSNLHTFLGGREGQWKVLELRAITGAPLHPVGRLRVTTGMVDPLPAGAEWALRGVTSNERYVIRSEKEQLVAKQQALGRPEALRAALIPIKKSAAWWAMTQDERRRIFEEASHHTQIGLEYLPAIARRLHHCRDLSTQEPFDFLTWFEFAESDTAAFDHLLDRLRATQEWKYVERECELRLEKDGSTV